MHLLTPLLRVGFPSLRSGSRLMRSHDWLARAGFRHKSPVRIDERITLDYFVPRMSKRGRKPRNGRPVGRPRKKTDERQVFEPAKLGCTQYEAASVLGIDHRTFKRRLREPVFYRAWEERQAVGTIALRQLQWKHAKRPDASGVAMTIHMSKHLLGQHDKALHLNLTVQDVDELIARLEQQRTQQLGVNVGETSPN